MSCCGRLFWHEKTLGFSADPHISHHFFLVSPEKIRHLTGGVHPTSMNFPITATEKASRPRSFPMLVSLVFHHQRMWFSSHILLVLDDFKRVWCFLFWISEDFSRFPKIFPNFIWFSLVFEHVPRFPWIFSYLLQCFCDDSIPPSWSCVRPRRPRRRLPRRRRWRRRKRPRRRPVEVDEEMIEIQQLIL